MPGSFKCPVHQDWDANSRELKPVYQAALAAEAVERFLEFVGAKRAKLPLDSALGANPQRT